MYEVAELFSGSQCQTRLWLAQPVADALAKRSRKHRQEVGILMARLRRYAQNGFALYEGNAKPIRPEPDGVYRIGHPDDLFRIIGFYDHDSRTDFIAIDAFEKRGHGLSASDQARIANVARVKKQGLWKKKNNYAQYPRLAQTPR